MGTLLDIFKESDLAAIGVNASRLSGRHTHDSVHTGEGREINIKFGLPSFTSKHEKNHDLFPQLGMLAGTKLANLTIPALGNRPGFGIASKNGLSLSI